ncbi:MAG: methyl-accepting chemotaxis protein [Gemmatimonadota bacterium]|nr:methyl-accepting chemotaxis protein [Gemmatimonadota bacterium]
MGGSIIRKIVTGFGIVLALAMVVGAVGLFALRGARSSNTEVASQVLVDDVLARDVKEHFLRADQAYLRALIEPSNIKWRAARDTELRQAADKVGILHDSVDEEVSRKGWDVIGTDLRTWDGASARSLAAATAGKRDEAMAVRNAEVLPLSGKIEVDVTALVETEVKQTRALIDGSQANIGRAISYLDVAAIGTLLAGIFFSWLVTRSITRPLRETTGVLASSSAEILAATSEQATGANESMAAVAQTAATVDQVAQTTEQAAQRARTVAEGAQRASEIGRSGRAAVDNSIAVMGRVVEQVESMRSGIRALGEQAELIRGITSTVDEIAERSNLLALNAAIEAARAGEEGRGFAVVAGEIRSLAEQSKRATVEVRNIVGDIQRAAASAALVADEGSRQASESQRAVTEAGETIRLLGETMGEASQAAAQIAASAGQQATGMAQIRQAMRNIREVTQQNLIATQQTERAAKDLTQVGSTLVELVGGRPLREG